MDIKMAKGEAYAVIVMVHGAGEHSGRYEWLTEKWNENGCHVVLGDLPGQGKTNGLRGYIKSFDDYIRTVVIWINEAKKAGLPIILFGHSMGGLVLIRTLMIRTLPVKAVILSSPCLGLVNNPPKLLEEFSKLLNLFSPKFRLDTNIAPGLGTRNEELKAKDAIDPLYNRKVSIRWYRELRKAMNIAHKEPEQFPNVPLLVLQGGDDRIVNKHDVKAWFDRLTIHEKIYKEWDGLFHEVFNEPEREQVFQFALHFVQKKLVNG
ncbi:alpha/beta hydrolase [Pueribacillus sp. YX66]|uniref:alpha/beta hydrolase n=1 Tax=Pueribacillus sp. YX66 TaxID=3229242 RepID=UPI00358D4A86